jgi:hypothetical protein
MVSCTGLCRCTMISLSLRSMGCVSSWYSAIFRRRVSAKAFHASCTLSSVSSLSAGSFVCGTTVCATAAPPFRAGFAAPTSSDNRGVFSGTALRGVGMGEDAEADADVETGAGAEAGAATVGSAFVTLIFFLTPLRRVRRDGGRNERGPSS